MTRPTAAFGLALFVVLGWSMIRASAPTYDEPVHLASGYAALLNGSRLINGRDHPPLAEMWAALPLLALRPAAFFHHPDWVMGRVYNYADFFLYKNRVDGERMLNAARLWCLLSWGGLLALGILAWARRLGGAPAMAAAGLLLGLCPPLFTNAGLVTTDAGSAALFFLMFWILGSPTLTWPRWLAAGAVMGAAMACFEAALRYTQDRRQFNKPLASFQLIQKDLVDMFNEIVKAQAYNIRLGRLQDEGKGNYVMVSLGKMNACREALKIARMARNLLGANGISLEYHVIRHMTNLESVFTYEGTDNMHHLIVGRHLTGLSAFQG